MDEIFIILIFRLGEKDDDKEKNAPEIAEKVAVSVEEKEKIDMSEYKQIHTEEELNETLKNIPKNTTVKPTEIEKENEQIKNEEKRAEQTKQLQQKRDFKNGIILSETLTFEEFKTAIGTYAVTENEEKKTEGTNIRTQNIVG